MPYTLPKLPYDYNALEPHMDEETLRIHHDKHHQSYVDGLNKAMEALDKARKNSDFAMIKHYERELAFHGSGHILHTLFWENLTPAGKDKPNGDLLKQIEKDFGSYEAFKAQFTQAAIAVEGSGWVILVYHPMLCRLDILQCEKHQNLTVWGSQPILILDVWEHAYYLKHQNKRPEYIQDFWKICNWDKAEARFTHCCKCQ
ncbi:superoxide dismutase [Oceanirhabdus sp. W0125-5]|uniref:superoxide dismutase n=1 Tax=Oceanirhabdus sp. W0125-5 TaxID=2999116 RepID=UPI0022F31CE8|nr:superoxide dismutase [Oceanirhabdus sp. W0125-5]WBW97451.1 superoxide dismutase [Oceanirhabdus sp. W0125-5]